MKHQRTATYLTLPHGRTLTHGAPERIPGRRTTYAFPPRTSPSADQPRAPPPSDTRVDPRGPLPQRTSAPARASTRAPRVDERHRTLARRSRTPQESGRPRVASGARGSIAMGPPALWVDPITSGPRADADVMVRTSVPRETSTCRPGQDGPTTRRREGPGRCLTTHRTATWARRRPGARPRRGADGERPGHGNVRRAAPRRAASARHRRSRSRGRPLRRHRARLSARTGSSAQGRPTHRSP